MLSSYFPQGASLAAQPEDSALSLPSPSLRTPATLGGDGFGVRLAGSGSFFEDHAGIAPRGRQEDTHPSKSSWKGYPGPRP